MAFRAAKVGMDHQSRWFDTFHEEMKEWHSTPPLRTS